MFETVRLTIMIILDYKKGGKLKSILPESGDVVIGWRLTLHLDGSRLAAPSPLHLQLFDESGHY